MKRELLINLGESFQKNTEFMVQRDVIIQVTTLKLCSRDYTSNNCLYCAQTSNAVPPHMFSTADNSPDSLAENQLDETVLLKSFLNNFFE